jgi:hypothetical protein
VNTERDELFAADGEKGRVSMARRISGEKSSLADDSSPPMAKGLRLLGLGDGFEPLSQALEGGLGGHAPRASCVWIESGGFPNPRDFDSTCWLGGGQQGCRSHIRKICATG